MDFGVKFNWGLAAKPGTVSRVEPTAQPAAAAATISTTIGAAPQPHDQQRLQSYDTTAAE